MKKILCVIVCFFIYSVALAGTVSVKPNGIAFPYWYGYSEGTKASYYLAMPTLSANDTAVGLAATQTLTSKTFTSPALTTPVITGVVSITSATVGADQFKVDAQGLIAGNAINLETTDGGIILNADGAANGDIGIDAADDLTLTAAGNLTLAITGTVTAGGSAITNVLSDSEDVTAANVLTAAEASKVFFLNSATEFQTTLPAISTVAAGTRFTFIVKAAPASASYTIITANSLENVVTGGVVERETDTGEDGPYAADADTITFVDGVAVAGDYVEFISDGSTYYMHGQVDADGALTIAQAD